jgi:Mlc titration factor MtfA (ptsG expression regulator)
LTQDRVRASRVRRVVADLWQSLLDATGRGARRIDDLHWQRLLGTSRLFDRLDTPTRARLRALCEQFLARKSFSAASGHVLDDDQCLCIAAFACLPVLGTGLSSLAGWQEVIVYPGGFRVRREHQDADSGVITEFDDEVIGEAWERGPLVVSWADIAEDLAHPFDGFNVVIHEIAHKLDMLDGAMDGIPRLPATIRRGEWIATMQSALDALTDRVDAGESTAIDPYATESAEEFFAVTSELHFSDPHLLAREAPGVAALLARFYTANHAEAG